MIRNDQLDQWDRAHFFHPSTHLGQFARGEMPNRIITGGQGVYITDRDGTRLLDAFAGLYCVNVGYGRPEIAEAIAAQARELAYYHAYVGHGTEASITLARMVLERAPKNMSKVYFGLGGSDANETNIKLVWYYNNILGRPRQEDHHLALARLSRFRPDDRIADRARAVPQEVRPAAGSGDAHRGAVLFPPPRHRRCRRRNSPPTARRSSKS